MSEEGHGCAADSLLLDTNAWLYYFTGEGKRGADVAALIVHCANHSIPLLYTPTTLKDVFYLVPRYLKRAAPGDDADGAARNGIAWGVVNSMMELAVAAPLAAGECELAHLLRSKHPDLEDNLLLAAAERVSARYVVTYDGKLQKRFPALCVPADVALDTLALSDVVP